MPGYYVDQNAGSNDENAVHVIGCPEFPVQRMYLGEFENCREALAAARKYYRLTNGCYRCCPQCHEG